MAQGAGQRDAAARGRACRRPRARRGPGLPGGGDGILRRDLVDGAAPKTHRAAHARPGGGRRGRRVSSGQMARGWVRTARGGRRGRSRAALRRRLAERIDPARRRRGPRRVARSMRAHPPRDAHRGPGLDRRHDPHRGGRPPRRRPPADGLAPADALPGERGIRRAAQRRRVPVRRRRRRRAAPGHLHRPHRAVLVGGRRRIEPRRRESRGSMRRRRRPSARRGDPPGLLDRNASRRGGDVIGSVRASQDRRRRRDPTRDGDGRRRRRRRRSWFRGGRRGAASFGAMGRRRRRDVRFVFAAVAEDRRGGRLDRRGATVSRGRRAGLRRPHRDPVEGVEPGGLGIRAGGHGGLRRRLLDVGRRRRGGGVVAEGSRGVVRERVQAHVHAAAGRGHRGVARGRGRGDPAGPPGRVGRRGGGSRRRVAGVVVVRRRRRFEPETLSRAAGRRTRATARGATAGPRAWRGAATGTDSSWRPRRAAAGLEEEEEEEAGTSRRGARRRVGFANFYSRRLAPGITSTRPRGAAPARTCSGRRTGS